jgi:transcriptional regulator with XRE-family HTH domain
MQIERSTGHRHSLASQAGAMTIAQVIGERLKQVRFRCGLTQDGVAQKARDTRKNQTPLNKQTVYRLEKGTVMARKETIARLARALEVDPEVLVGEKPSQAHLRIKPPIS